MTTFKPIKPSQEVQSYKFVEALQKYCDDRNIIMILGDVQYQDDQLANLQPRVELIDSVDDEGNPIQTEVLIQRPEKDQYILGVDIDPEIQFDQRNNQEYGVISGYISLSQKFTDQFSSNIGESFRYKYDTRFKNWAQTANDIFKEFSSLHCESSEYPSFNINSWKTTFALNNFNTSIDRVVVAVSFKVYEV